MSPLFEAFRMTGSPKVLSAFTEEQAARLTGLTRGRLSYWHKTGFFRPSLSQPNEEGPFSRIYSFKDIVCLRTLAILVKDHKIPLPHLRDVQRRLFDMDQNRWGDTSLYVLGRKVYFERPDGGFEQGDAPQLALHNIPLQRVLGEVTRAVEQMKKRADRSIGKITAQRNVMGSARVIEGTRIPITTIKDCHDAGWSVDQILTAYPTLRRDDVVNALQHYGIRAA